MTQTSTARSETRNTTCYMCACRCGIRVTLTDGEIRYIEGNPDHPINKGVICAKGASGIMKQHSPARLTRPLRRKSGAERGANEFEAISWDEAFTILEASSAETLCCASAIPLNAFPRRTSRCLCGSN